MIEISQKIKDSRKKIIIQKGYIKEHIKVMKKSHDLISNCITCRKGR